MGRFPSRNTFYFLWMYTCVQIALAATLFICSLQLCEGTTRNTMADGNFKEQSWPDLVGKTPEEAEAQIKKDRPDVKIQILGHMDPATMDYRLDRVRIIIGEDGKVMMPPMTG